MTEPIDPINHHALAAKTRQWSESLAQLKTLKCPDQATYAVLGEWAKQAKTVVDEFEAERLELTKPLNAQLKTVNAAFKQYTGPVAEARTEILRIMSEYKAEEKRLADKARALAAEAAKDGDTQAVYAALATVPAVPDKPKGVVERVMFEAEVIAPGDVPRQWLKVDTAAIDAYAKTLDPSREIYEIGGVRFTRVVRTHTRG